MKYPLYLLFCRKSDDKIYGSDDVTHAEMQNVFHKPSPTNWRFCRIDQVKTLMATLEADMDKFYNKGNKAAGTRARKSLQDLKKLAQEIRIEIQNMKNS